MNVKVWKFFMLNIHFLMIYHPPPVHLFFSVHVFQVKSVFGAKMFALGVVVKIPVPKQTAKTNFTVTSGRAKYNASIDSLVWK